MKYKAIKLKTIVNFSLFIISSDQFSLNHEIHFYLKTSCFSVGMHMHVFVKFSLSIDLLKYIKWNLFPEYSK